MPLLPFGEEMHPHWEDRQPFSAELRRFQEKQKEQKSLGLSDWTAIGSSTWQDGDRGEDTKGLTLFLTLTLLYSKRLVFQCVQF